MTERRYVIFLKVEYLIGSNGSVLPSVFVEKLDDALIPVINDQASNMSHTVTLELVLFILNI